MGIQAAHAFLRKLRETSIADDLTRMRRDGDNSVEGLIALGAAQGLVFDTAEFYQAFRQDWLLRWLNFCTRNQHS